MRSLFCAILLSIPLVSNAAGSSPVGTWAMTAQGRVILVLAVESAGTTGVAGSIVRPSRMQIAPQLSFSHIEGPAHMTTLRDARIAGNRLSFSASPPTDPNRLDQFELTVVDDETSHLKVTGVPVPPFVLVRVDSATQISDRWDRDAVYLMDDHAKSNEELRQLYEADQRERANFATTDHKALLAADASRRQRVRDMLAKDEVRSGQDFARAAMIFQHGNTSDDYLLAHTLATIAVAKGNAEALWLGSATLDRYLSSIGQPQIYGTQFKRDGDGPITQGAFNSALIADSLRRRLGVPALAEQEALHKKFEEMTQPRQEKK